MYMYDLEDKKFIGISHIKYIIMFQLGRLVLLLYLTTIVCQIKEKSNNFQLLKDYLRLKNEKYKIIIELYKEHYLKLNLNLILEFLHFE